VASVNDRAELHLVHTTGETLDEEGQAKGALPGAIQAKLRVGATFSGTMVFSTQNGQIEASGTAQPRRGQGPIETFAGTAHITGGSGRYVHAHGGGGFSGSFDRRDYAVVLQTSGSFSY
jgi:hypothetical protein